MRWTFDSRQVRPGMGFVALKGEKSDGHAFIPQALAAGAADVIDGLDELQRRARDYRNHRRQAQGRTDKGRDRAPRQTRSGCSEGVAAGSCRPRFKRLGRRNDRHNNYDYRRYGGN